MANSSPVVSEPQAYVWSRWIVSTAPRMTRLDCGTRADGYNKGMELAPLTDDEIQRLLYPRRRAVGPGSFIATIRIPDGSEKDHEITAGTYDGGRLIADRIADSSHGIVSGFRRAAR